MKVVFPMGGVDADFIGEFGVSKPAVKILDRTMIEMACSMFPYDSSMLFICRRDDLQQGVLHSVLEGIKDKYPNTHIIEIKQKGASVFDTLDEAGEYILPTDALLVVHYDSLAVFDFHSFLKHVKDEGPCGALTTFDGFNPCDIHSSDFGRVSVNGHRVTGIHEKQLLSKDQVTAAGCYYFSSWQLFKACSVRYVSNNRVDQRSLYLSEVYNELLKDGKKVTHFPVKRFISFGRPVDVKVYRYWAQVFAGSLPV
ncbi:MAG: hypothetical protein HQM16_01675 [Deltaproteobacteria bacterium]|nr:hypothetical protein [Deltaproteobacteria bacterium]